MKDLDLIIHHVKMIGIRQFRITTTHSNTQ